MKRFLLLFSVLIITKIAVAQPPEYFVDNWYLHSFSFNGEIFINTLGITEEPTLITQSDYTLYGRGFCNNYSGTFEYTSYDPLGVDDTFRPRNIIRETENCDDFEDMETHFFLPFVQENIADIYVINPQGNEKHIVLQYSTGYQVYKNFPALSISDSSFKDFLIFPNPVQEKLFIYSEILGFKSILITDINGRTVMNFTNEPSNEVDVSDLKSGLYFIRIESPSGSVTKKFIKN